MSVLYYLQYQESKFDYIPPWYQEEKYMYTIVINYLPWWSVFLQFGDITEYLLLNLDKIIWPK